MKKRLILAAVMAIAVIYAGCKKSGNAPSSTTNDDQVSLQVAQNLINMLNGGFGYDPSTNGSTEQGNSLRTVNSTKRRVNSTTGTDCSFSEDTTMAFTVKLDTIAESLNGKFTVSANLCAPTATFGVIEDYKLLMTTPSLSGNYKLNANLTFSFAGDDNSEQLVFGGTIGVNASLNFLKGSKGTSNETYNYNFHALTEDENGIESGSATFTTTGSGSRGNWNYTGTITFQAGNKATLTLGKKTFHVDLNTGKVTAG